MGGKRFRKVECKTQPLLSHILSKNGVMIDNGGPESIKVFIKGTPAEENETAWESEPKASFDS
jgi:hypothetical protein